MGPYREDGEFRILIKEQRDYHRRFKVYFRMSVAQFDAFLAILEPHIKKKTTNFCEFKDHLARIYYISCFVLQDEVNELDNHHSGFWRSLVRWFWTVKTPLKMLATAAKNTKNQTRSDFFLWWTKIPDEVCKRDWYNVRSYLFFNMWTFRTSILESVCNDL